MVSELEESGNKGDTECGRKGNKIIRDSGYWERRYSPIEERAWRYGMRKIYVHYAGRKEKRNDENRNRTHKPRTCPHTKVDRSKGPKRVSISHRNHARLRSSEGLILELLSLSLARSDSHKCFQAFFQPASEAFAFPLPANIVIAIGFLDVSRSPEPVQDTVPTDEH